MSSVPTEAPQNQAAKLKMLAAFAKKINTGAPNTFIRMGDRPVVKVPVIPTGFLHFDYEALGPGGIPRGRIIEIFGPESSGKSSICQHITAQCQKAGGIAAYIDLENTLDPAFAKNLGVDIDALWLSQPDSAEQALNLVDDLIETQAVDLIVIDTVAALVPQAELEGDIGDAHVGLVARLMSQTLRKITKPAEASKTTVIFVNQIREKIGVLYGNPETQPGGRALKFYASVRMDVRRKGWISEKGNHVVSLPSGEQPTGQTIRVKLVKNKVGAPFRESYIDLYFPTKEMGGGFDKHAQTVDLAFERGVVYKENEKSTKYFFDWPTGKDTIEKREVAIGQDKAKATVLEEAELYEAVEKNLKEILSA